MASKLNHDLDWIPLKYKILNDVLPSIRIPKKSPYKDDVKQVIKFGDYRRAFIYFHNLYTMEAAMTETSNILYKAGNLQEDAWLKAVTYYTQNCNTISFLELLTYCYQFPVLLDIENPTCPSGKLIEKLQLLFHARIGTSTGRYTGLIPNVQHISV